MIRSKNGLISQVICIFNPDKVLLNLLKIYSLDARLPELQIILIIQKGLSKILLEKPCESIRIYAA